MIIFLYGFDSYRLKQKLDEIIDKYKNFQTTSSLVFFDFEENSFKDFENEIQSDSIFKKKKLIVLKNIFSNLEFQEKFLDYAKKFAKKDLSKIILLSEQDLTSKKNSVLFKFLKKHGKCQEFKLLNNQELRYWAREEFKKYQVQIEPMALEQLINFVGNNLWRLSNEIKKLVIFKKKITNPKEKVEIKIEDINLLINPKIETAIFKTIDALANGRKKEVFTLLAKHLKKGDSPLYLLSMIGYQFRNLLVVKDFLEKKKTDAEIIKISGLHPYVAKKTIEQVKKFSLEKLKKTFQKIFQADVNIKTGRLDPWTALNLLIMEI